MSRPAFTLTDAQKAEVETLAAVLNAEQVADYFGIGRRTFYDMMKRDEEIAARYKRGKARAIGAIAQGLIAKARGGDTASMIFYLKTQAGCATVGSDGSGPGACPPVVEYSREFQARAAEELDLLPEGSAIAEMMSDYAVMREQARDCW